MGLLQIGLSIVAALLVGLFARGAVRMYLLVAVSVLAVFWFQPALPLRSFDFWLPLFTLGFVVLTWLLTTGAATWRSRPNLIGAAIMLGLVVIIEATRYLGLDPLLTKTIAPPFLPFAVILICLATLLAVWTWTVRRSVWALTSAVVFLIVILVILKTPALAQWGSMIARGLTGQSVEQASALDLRWLGFSYIAFRLIHVLRDKQTGRLPALTLPEFATYVVFFPALSAGPIDRAERFAQDLRKEAVIDQDLLLNAGQRIALGLFKKFVVADALALIALNDTLAGQIKFTGWMWVALYAYAFQIYFDFSGYTDIAIGIACLVGIKLPENFAAPYLKPNITQFWNNWHMTLTQWVRAYFFNPFNRWVRGYKNLPAWTMIFFGQLSTMLLIGLWHGVTLNFILWGTWHGLGLFIHNRWTDFLRTRPIAMLQDKRLQSALNVMGILATFHFVAFSWLFFALSTPAISLTVFLKLFGLK